LRDGRCEIPAAKFKLAIANDQENVKKVFTTNLRVVEDNAKILFKEQGKH